MKKNIIVVLMGLGLITGVHAQTVESQNVVGFFKVDIESNAYSLISVPMQKMTVYGGQISANTTTDIQDSSATWTVDEFAVGADTTGRPYAEPGLSTFYIEITSPTGGAYYGRHYYVTNNTANTLTVVGGDFSAGNLVGAGYKIVPANRVRDLLGEATSPVIASGVNSSLADNMLAYNGSSWDTYYAHSSLSKWLKVGAGVTEQANVVLDRDEGLFINRRGSPTNIVITGEVSANDRGIIIEGAGSYNLLKITSVVDTPIGSTSLSSQLAAGVNSSLADNILAYNGASWDTYYYHSSLNRWLKVGAGTADQGSIFILKAGSGYFVKRIGAQVDYSDPTPLN